MKKTSTGKAASFKRVRKLTDSEILERAATDPETRVLATDELKRFRRGSQAKFVRLKLGLSQPEFAKRFGIPLGTLRDWEQRRAEPDQAARSYLAVIAANPNAVRKALEPA